MDPVSHLLFARMVAALRPAQALPRGAVVATVLGGLSPDVDAALMAFGWDVYLGWHDAGTHALVGTVPVAMLTAAAVRTWATGTSLATLTFAAWLGALSHVFFDIYSGASVRVLWPLANRQWSAPVVAMADPIAMAVLLVGAVALWLSPREGRTAAALVMALLAVVTGAKLTTRSLASASYAEAAAGGSPVAEVAIEAVWGSWHRWLFFDRLEDGRLRAWAVDGWRRRAELRFEQSPTRHAGFAQASLAQFAAARNFVATHPFAFATERPADAERSAVVFWSDVRFCWSAREQPDPQEGAPHQDVRPAAGPLRCALWFGGSFDAEGRPLESLVWLGGHLQRRAPLRWAR